MRIAFLVNQFPSVSETFILNQITGLIDRGHEVDIYAGAPAETAEVHSEVERYHLLDRTYYWPPMPHNPLNRILKGSRFFLENFSKEPAVLLRSLNVFHYGKKAAFLQLLYRAIPLLEKQPYDIIHCQFGPTGLIGEVLRAIGAIKGKLIVSFRGFDISRCLEGGDDHLYDRLFDTADLFLPVSENIKQKLIGLGCEEKKIVIHRSGIDCSEFSFSPRPIHSGGKIRILTVARLIEKKGVKYGIRAIAKLREIRRDIEYTVVGDGPLKGELIRLIQALDIGDEVELVGWKKHEDVIQVLENSDILLAPSVTARSGDQEGIPNVLKEAMAMGLPVVSTLHSGIPELIQDRVSGFLVPERDVDALAEKLKYLIEHQEMWSEMGSAGRKQVEENYDINKLNDRLIELYRQLLNGKLKT
jgi:colanic acid/amylovoran biosynthesis glycosyltransferase